MREGAAGLVLHEVVEPAQAVSQEICNGWSLLLGQPLLRCGIHYSLKIGGGTIVLGAGHRVPQFPAVVQPASNLVRSYPYPRIVAVVERMQCGGREAWKDDGTVMVGNHQDISRRCRIHAEGDHISRMSVGVSNESIEHNHQHDVIGIFQSVKDARTGGQVDAQRRRNERPADSET